MSFAQTGCVQSCIAAAKKGEPTTTDGCDLVERKHAFRGLLSKSNLSSWPSQLAGKDSADTTRHSHGGSGDKNGESLFLNNLRPCFEAHSPHLRPPVTIKANSLHALDHLRLVLYVPCHRIRYGGLASWLPGKRHSYSKPWYCKQVLLVAKQNDIGEDRFKASSGWIENFRHRHNIRSGKWIGSKCEFIGTYSGDMITPSIHGFPNLGVNGHGPVQSLRPPVISNRYCSSLPPSSSSSRDTRSSRSSPARPQNPRLAPGNDAPKPGRDLFSQDSDINSQPRPVISIHTLPPLLPLSFPRTRFDSPSASTNPQRLTHIAQQ
ncbi:hypothetical protein NMY22_g15055 [Coprinellus aureogranulatus]|nr:hypothetical protein NMY22_g15055 [Coprinellus aureogranulatus]